jgi:hypothetical protein
VIATKERKNPARKPQPKELNHGWHESHGFETHLNGAIYIRVIRAIRGKIFTESSDWDR